MDLRVTPVRFTGSSADMISGVRRAVFTLEQGVDPDLDLDGQDPLAIHALAMANGSAVGTGRMLEDGHIGRVAVMRAFRGRGIGQRIIHCLVAEARAGKLARVFLGAQVHAVPFYKNLGFTPYGSPYEEAGISHIHMALVLTPQIPKGDPDGRADCHSLPGCPA